MVFRSEDLNCDFLKPGDWLRNGLIKTDFFFVLILHSPLSFEVFSELLALLDLHRMQRQGAIQSQLLSL